MRHFTTSLAVLLAVSTLTACEKDPLTQDEDADGFVGADDCDDSDAAINPDATETCDGIDNNCDGAVDEGVALEIYVDADGDGFGSGEPTAACEALDGEATEAGDCDDGNTDVYPGAPEDDCTDPVDYNCDGSVQYADGDGDGFAACEDCDDTNEDINPDATEVCDAADNDCDDEIDEGDAADASTYYEDFDGDGYGDEDVSIQACPGNVPDGYVEDNTDCDDIESGVNPEAAEACDGFDTNCDSVIAETVVSSGSSLQAAIDSAVPGEWLCVEPGTYTGTVLFNGTDVTLESMEGADTTIIDGDGDGPVLQIVSGETAATTVKGFTVTNGFATQEGAGVYVANSSPNFEDLIVVDNIADSVGGEGGGMAFVDSDVVMVGSIVTGNYFEGGNFGGAGVGMSGGSTVIDDTLISYNYLFDPDGGTPWGGGLACVSGDLSLTRSWLAGNTVESSVQLTGSGFSAYNCDSDLMNVVIAGNSSTGTAEDYGGAAIVSSGSATLTNVSVTGNTSDAPEGRVGVVALSSTITMVNTDISNNVFSDTTVSGQASDGVACLFGTGDVTMSYSNLYGNSTGSGSEDCDSSGWSNMLEVDPGYTDTSSTDPELWDLTLATGSGLIDAGDPSITDEDESTSDIGAYGGPAGSGW